MERGLDVFDKLRGHDAATFFGWFYSFYIVFRMLSIQDFEERNMNDFDTVEMNFGDSVIVNASESSLQTCWEAVVTKKREDDTGPRSRRVFIRVIKHTHEHQCRVCAGGK